MYYLLLVLNLIYFCFKQTADFEKSSNESSVKAKLASKIKTKAQKTKANITSKTKTSSNMTSNEESDKESTKDMRAIKALDNKGDDNIEKKKSVYKSKRLQQQQKGLNEMDDQEGSEENNEDFNEDSKDASDDEESESESSSSSNEHSSSESEGEPDEWKPERQSTPTKDIRCSQRVAKKRECKKLEQAESTPSTDDDEDSNKPLALVKKELKESPEKVITKVLKVMRKVKLKNGEVKKKLVKVIKKVKFVNKQGVPKVPGMRRTRCNKCKNCLVTEDCGKCVFCM